VNGKEDTIERPAVTILLGLVGFIGRAALPVLFPPRWPAAAVYAAGVVVCTFLSSSRHTYRVLRSVTLWVFALLSTAILWLVLAICVRQFLLFLLGIA